MIKANGRSLPSAMTYIPPRNFWYHTRIGLGEQKSDPPPNPSILILVIDTIVMLGGDVTIGEGIDLGDHIHYLVDQPLPRS